jgi:hypothetical protein
VLGSSRLEVRDTSDGRGQDLSKSRSSGVRMMPNESKAISVWAGELSQW